MKCKCCNEKDAVKYSEYTSGEFCSKKCSRSFSTKGNRVEINSKVSQKMKGRRVGGHSFKNGYDARRWIFTDEDREKSKLAIQSRIDRLEFDDLGAVAKRKRILAEQKYSCLSCGITEWNGAEIVLEIDHINRDRNDNSRENLRALCPNCHSQTEFFRGRGRTNKSNVTNKILIEALNSCSSIKEALASVGLSNNTGNYFRAKRLAEKSVI